MDKKSFDFSGTTFSFFFRFLILFYFYESCQPMEGIRQEYTRVETIIYSALL